MHRSAELSDRKRKLQNQVNSIAHCVHFVWNVLFLFRYIGVSWDSELNQWEARRGLESAGFYNSDFEAAKASDRLQRAKDGINANIGLNFPGIYSEDVNFPKTFYFCNLLKRLNI